MYLGELVHVHQHPPPHHHRLLTRNLSLQVVHPHLVTPHHAPGHLELGLAEGIFPPRVESVLVRGPVLAALPPALLQKFLDEPRLDVHRHELPRVHLVVLANVLHPEPLDARPAPANKVDPFPFALLLLRRHRPRRVKVPLVKGPVHDERVHLVGHDPKRAAVRRLDRRARAPELV